MKQSYNPQTDIYIPIPSPNDPNELGHFGIFGGRYVPETLMPTLEQLRLDYEAVRFDIVFVVVVDQTMLVAPHHSTMPTISVKKLERKSISKEKTSTTQELIKSTTP
jgi:hypothetical protein